VTQPTENGSAVVDARYTLQTDTGINEQQSTSKLLPQRPPVKCGLWISNQIKFIQSEGTKWSLTVYHSSTWCICCRNNANSIYNNKIK